MHDIVVLKIVVRMLLPLILMYAFYIQFHGGFSPGGGFQAGIIFAVGLIAYSLVNDIGSLKKNMSIFLVRIIAATGILIYSIVGVVSMFMGGRFLEYSIFTAIPEIGQKLGIILVEIGIGLTVFAVIMLIFYSFGERSDSGS